MHACMETNETRKPIGRHYASSDGVAGGKSSAAGRPHVHAPGHRAGRPGPSRTRPPSPPGRHASIGVVQRGGDRRTERTCAADAGEAPARARYAPYVRPGCRPVMSCPATAKWHQRVAHGIWIFPWPPGRETCGGSLPLVLIGARRSSSCSYGDTHASLRGCLVPRPYMATPQQAQLGTGRGRRFARHGKHCSVAGAPVAMARRAVTPTQQPLNISSFSTQSNKQLLGASAASSSIYGLLHDARDREG
jgi:hypothetical protein